MDGIKNLDFCPFCRKKNMENPKWVCPHCRKLTTKPEAQIICPHCNKKLLTSTYGIISHIQNTCLEYKKKSKNQN